MDGFFAYVLDTPLPSSPYRKDQQETVFHTKGITNRMRDKEPERLYLPAEPVSFGTISALDNLLI
jgi:hypothetical protein